MVELKGVRRVKISSEERNKSEKKKRAVSPVMTVPFPPFAFSFLWPLCKRVGVREGKR
jgi:hypothetical protein